MGNISCARKTADEKYHTVTVLKWVFLFSIFILVPLGFADMQAIQWDTLNSRTIFDILFVVVGVTFIAYLMNVFALKALSPSVVSAYIYTQPIMAAAIALMLGKDHLTWEKIVSAVLIFAGVMLASQTKKNDVQIK
jgi:drug/metabolite transporter (DMT)-like permease